MSAEETAPSQPNGFLVLGAELVRRTKRPLGQVVYWGFFVLFVVVLGALAFWVEVVQYFKHPAAERDAAAIYMALVTFFPAVIGSACAQMMVEAKNKRLHMFSLLVFAASLIAGLLLIGAAKPIPAVAWPAACGLSFAALWVWWIANADNLALHDDADSDAAVGGDPNAPLAGDFSGITV